MKDLNSPMRPVLYLTKEFGFSKKKKKKVKSVGREG